MDKPQRLNRDFYRSIKNMSNEEMSDFLDRQAMMAVENYKKEAQDYILKKYNWDEVVNKTLELFIKSIFGTILHLLHDIIKVSLSAFKITSGES